MTHAADLLMVVLDWTYLAFPPTMLTVLIVHLLIQRER